ncbi:hypothetical protein HispidOSU_018787, partial [Sigmodon hispidus]
NTKKTDPEGAGKPFPNKIDIYSFHCTVSAGNDKVKCKENKGQHHRPLRLRLAQRALQ